MPPRTGGPLDPPTLSRGPPGPLGRMSRLSPSRAERVFFSSTFSRTSPRSLMGYGIKKRSFSWSHISQNIMYRTMSDSHTYPTAEDLLHRLRVIKHHESKVRQLSATVDSQLKDSAELCAREMSKQVNAGGADLHFKISSSRKIKLASLTFKEFLELALIHVVRYVSDKELVAVGIPDRSPHLWLPDLTLPHC